MKGGVRDHKGMGGRLARRRLLRAAAVGGAGAALAAACSRESKPKESGAAADATAGPFGLVAQVQDTTKDARAGGAFRSWVVQDANGLDPYVTQLGAGVDVGRMVYSRLMMAAPRGIGNTAGGTRDLEPELAESLEVSPDRLQWTFKLRGNVKWDARAPTSSRPVDARDVVFSWERFEALHQARRELSNMLSPDAPIISASAPDARTVVFKQAFPMATALNILNSNQRLVIMPREAEGGFDPRRDARGSSLFVLSEYRPSAGFTFTKNPNWYRNDRPFIETWEMPIVPEYAQRLAQFRAGNVFAAALRVEDILSTKKDVPALNMYQGEWGDSYSSIVFGLKSGSPFKDARVRQAVSMLIDRQTLIEVFGSLDEFKKEGLQVETRWYTHAGCKPEEGWIDPLGKEFGPNAKYYQFNVAEARKLLAAAGHAQGFSTDLIYSSTGQLNFKLYDAVAAMLAEGGIKSKVAIWENTTEYTPKVLRSKGNWDGFAMSGGATARLPLELLFRRYHSDGTNFTGLDPTGTDPTKGDPMLNSLIAKARQEFDLDKRNALVHDLQRLLAEQMYAVPYAGEHPGFELVWPAVRNWGVYRAGSNNGESTEVYPHLWIDPNQAPLAR